MPDDVIGWLPWALFYGRHLTRREGIRAILASGPPFSVVLAGAILKGLTGLPFIADFRDAWVQDPVDPFGCVGGAFRAPYGDARKKMMARLERYAISRADAVLFTSEYTCEAYCRAYPEAQAKVAVLYNGVEESDFLSPSDWSVPFAFTYVGTLHEFQVQQVGLFLRAFAVAAKIEPDLAVSRVRICGHRPRAFRDHIEGLVRELQISELVTCQGPIPHTVGVSLMKSPGALLVFSGNSRFMRPSKISDYLVVQRPILALAPEDSETARQIRRFGHRLYSGSSPEELAKVIRGVWRAHRQDGAPPDSFPFPYPHPLHWRTTAFGVAAILDRFCRSDASGADRPAKGSRAPRWRIAATR
jgi:glycosyltransferase involved in cell wall biosynthesis